MNILIVYILYEYIIIVILLPIEYSFGGPSIPPHSHLELGKLTTD